VDIIVRFTNLDQALPPGTGRRNQVARSPKGVSQEEPAVHIVIERAAPKESIKQLDSVEGATEPKVLGGREWCICGYNRALR
jgi:hypothetical protein